MNRRKLNILMLLVGSILLLVIEISAFQDRRYHLVSAALVLLACVPFFGSYEKKHADTRQLVVIAVLTTLAVMGRLLFAMVPGFKPVTAVVVLAGMYLGSEAGFLTGALSAVVSNMLFGQGPWTPFQMFTWGLIGLIAGLPLMRRLLKMPIPLAIYGVFSGILYSMLMDIWTVLSADGGFSITRYLAQTATAVPFMIIYAVSNVVFLLLMRRPIGEKLDRMRIKYGIGIL